MGFCRAWDWTESQYEEMREKFCETFEYDETSESFLRWKITPGRRCKAGDVAGCLRLNGYWYVRFESKQYKVHQVIWIMHGNIIPKPLSIDHADQDKTNNNINNLRLLTYGEQNMNQKPRNGNKYKGVSWCKSIKKWVAQITINGKAEYIGYFKSELDAARAWDVEAIKLGRTDLNLV